MFITCLSSNRNETMELGEKHMMDCIVFSSNFYVEALAPNVTLLRDNSLKEVTKVK